MTPSESPTAEFPDALPIGSALGDFTVTRVLGLGGFGIVYMAHDRVLERTVAIKEYLPVTIAGRTSARTVLVRSTHQLDTYHSGLQSFIREARLQARFSHPAMLEVYQVWEQNGTAYMAMRYYPGSSLRDLRQDAQTSHLFDEASIRRIMSPVFDALQALHAENVLHRDVAPDNILIMPSGAPVLLDFGSARTVVAGDEQSLTTVLKPGYAPLEQYADDGAIAQGPWTDVYGLGAVLHYLAIGSPPPQAVARLMGGALSAFEATAPTLYSPEFVSAVNAALAVKTEDRMQSVAAFRDALGWSGEHAQEPTTVFLKAVQAMPVHEVEGLASSPTAAAPEIAAPIAPTLVPPAAVKKRRSPRLLVIGAAGALALAAVAYFASRPTAPVAAPTTAADARAVNPSAEGKRSTAAATSPQRELDTRAFPPMPNRGALSSSAAPSKTSAPANTTPTVATCDRLFAKLSLGNAKFTEAEEKLLLNCK